MMRTTYKPTKIAASVENACAAKIRTKKNNQGVLLGIINDEDGVSQQQ